MNYTLITGATIGIGYELALQFAKNGHNLILVARRKNKLQQPAEEIKTNYKTDTLILSLDLIHGRKRLCCDPVGALQSKPTTKGILRILPDTVSLPSKTTYLWHKRASPAQVSISVSIVVKPVIRIINQNR